MYEVLDGRGHLGGTFSLSSKAESSERGRRDVPWVGELLAPAPLIPSPPTLHLQAPQRHPP